MKNQKIIIGIIIFIGILLCLIFIRNFGYILFVNNDTIICSCRYNITFNNIDNENILTNISFTFEKPVTLEKMKIEIILFNKTICNKAIKNFIYKADNINISFIDNSNKLFSDGDLIQIICNPNIQLIIKIKYTGDNSIIFNINWNKYYLRRFTK